MVNPFSFKKEGFKQLFIPWNLPYGIPFTIIIFAILDVLFSPSFSNLYFKMYVGFIGFYILNNFIIKKQHKTEINAISGNTGRSIIRALVLLSSFLIIGFFVTSAFSAFTPGVFLDQSARAFLGANVEPILAGSTPVIFGVFSFLIPFVETVLYIEILISLLIIVGNIFKVQLLEDTTRFGILKKWQFWLANTIMGVGAVMFHLTAKGVSDLPLLLVFMFFTLTGAVAMVRDKSGRREMETAIWLHVLNNGLAMFVILNILSVQVLSSLGLA